eukprot:scaffold12935_cov85-Phaeocystis_antarctica.AAC.1
MYSMSAQLMDSLTSTSPPPPPSPPTSPPPPPSPAFERCDIGVWDNHHGHDCDSYVRHGFCCGSGACPHHEWTLGQPFNYPEKHCCACSPQVKTPGVTCDVAEHRRGTAAYVHTASVHETLVWSANGFKRNELLTTIATARSMAENAEQKRLFTAALQKQCGDEDKERSQFLTERKYEEVLCWRSSLELGLLKRRLCRKCTPRCTRRQRSTSSSPSKAPIPHLQGRCRR